VAGCSAAPPDDGPTSEAAQAYVPKPVPPPSVQFMNGQSGTGLCIGWVAAPSAGAPFVTTACGVTTSQLLYPYSDGTLRAGTNYGMCLSVFANDTNNGIIELQPCGNELFAQSWTFTRGRIALYTSGGTKCLAASTFAHAGAEVVLQSCTGSLAQYFVPLGMPVQISNTGNPFVSACMSAASNGVPMLEACSLGDTTQQFELTRANQIVARSQCLGVYAGNVAQGVLTMGPCSGAATQTWLPTLATQTFLFNGGGGMLEAESGSYGAPVIDGSTGNAWDQWNITLAMSGWTYPGLLSD
jgi:hypothetical protein